MTAKRIGEERLEELIAFGKQCSKSWIAVDVPNALRELLSARALLKECGAYLEHTSDCASVKRRCDRVPFGEKARAAFYDSLKCDCGLDALKARVRGAI